MEKLNGRIQKASRRSKKQALDMGSISSHRGAWYLWLTLACTLSIAGCSLPKIKSSLMTGIATTTAVGVTSVVAPGVLVPAIVGGTTAVIASALSAERSVKGEPVIIKADTVVQDAPDNLWTMLGKISEYGGIGLLIFFVATYLLPLILGYLIPNGFERKKKKKRI